MLLLHCIAIFYNLPWFCSIKVSNKKWQLNAENACGNWMCKRAFKEQRFFVKCKPQKKISKYSLVQTKVICFDFV